MAERSQQLVVAALKRAAAGEAPLHKSRQHPGLFPTTAAGKEAARICQAEGYLAPDSAGLDFRLTEKGFSYLFEQSSPRDVLMDLIRVLEARDAQMVELLQTVGQMRLQFAALREGTEQTLKRILPTGGVGTDGGLNHLFQSFVAQRVEQSTSNSVEELADRLLRLLDASAGRQCLGDTPLPQLYRQAAAETAALTLGQFHDALRRLYEQGHCYLHPWTGPLHEIPEPTCALLVGHEVAYYVSRRGAAAA